MFKNNMKFIWRNIKRYKGHMFMNITGLAVGFTCFILIFLWIQNVTSYENMHKNRENIYRTIMENMDAPGDSRRANISTPFILSDILKNENPEIKKAARVWHIRAFLVNYGKKRFYENMFSLVDPEIFNIFSFDLISGSRQNLLPDKNSVVITKDIKEKYFGAEEALGKTFTIDNRTDLTVTGVIKNMSGNSHLGFDFMASIEYLGPERINSWEYAVETYVLLNKSSSVKDLQKKAADTIIRHNPEMKFRVHFQPLESIHLYEPLGERGDIVTVYIFASVAIFVLIIALINFINLSTSLAGKRLKEIGVRKVAGAGKTQLTGQLLFESVLLSYISLFAAFCLTGFLVGPFNSLMEEQLEWITYNNINLYLFLAGMTFITGFVSGIYPAFFLTSPAPVKLLDSSLTQTKSRVSFKKILVLGQFVISISLIACTGIIYNQLEYVRNVQLGYNRDHLLYINAARPLRTNYETVKMELYKHSGILNVSAASSLPLYGENGIDVDWEGKAADQEEDFTFFMAVDYNFFETFEIQFAEGRSFSREFLTDRESYVVNEQALKLMGMKDPLGKRISLGRQFPNFGKEGSIIGVTKDFHFMSIHHNIRPMVFCMNPGWQRLIIIKVKFDQVSSTIEYAKKISEKYAPEFPFDYGFLDEELSQLYIAEERTGNLFVILSSLAVIISCMGLFGLVSFLVQRRTKEIGIRKVIGASTSSIIRLLLKDFVLLILFANILAWPLAHFATDHWLRDFAYKTDVFWSVYILSGLAALLIALITAGFQSLKAARSNPVDSLRYE